MRVQISNTMFDIISNVSLDDALKPYRSNPLSTPVANLTMAEDKTVKEGE